MLAYELDCLDFNTWDRARDEITRALVAKGLTEGTDKFHGVLDRKLRKRFHGQTPNSGY